LIAEAASGGPAEEQRIGAERPDQNVPNRNVVADRRRARRHTMTENELEMLRSHPLFARLSPDDIRELVSEGPIQRCPRGTILFQQDEPADRFFFILSGWVKLFRETAEGEQSVVAIFTRGESFAEVAIFYNARYPVTAEVIDDARLLVILAEPFTRRLRENFELVLSMMASMSWHLRALVQQLEQIKGRSATQRLADFLLRLAHNDGGAMHVHLPYDKALIAARLGMKPETFSRALAKLRAAGVQVERQQIVIPNVARLRRFCASRRTAAWSSGTGHA